MKLLWPVCYGLATASFGFTLQTYFSHPNKVNGLFYPLILMVIPLFVLGTIASILANNPYSRPTSAKNTAVCCYVMIILNGLMLGICIFHLHSGLGAAFIAGFLIAVALVKIVEKSHLLDQQSRTQPIEK